MCYQIDTTMYAVKKAQQLILKEFKKSEAYKGVSDRQRKHDAAAVSLGFKNANEAFNALGKEFLKIANA